MNKKRCNKCGKEKSLDSYYDAHHVRKDGTRAKNPTCKKCLVGKSEAWARKNPEKKREHQKRHRRNRSEIANARQALTSSRWNAKRDGYVPCVASIEEIVEAKTGRCFICGVDEADCRTGLCLDHDHETGKFRGWLCFTCNRALGMFQDSPEVLNAAYEYLVNC